MWDFTGRNGARTGLQWDLAPLCSVPSLHDVPVSPFRADHPQEDLQRCAPASEQPGTASPKPSSGWDGAEPALVLAGQRGLGARAGAGARFLPAPIRCAFIHSCVLTTGHMRGPAWPLGSRGNAAWPGNPLPRSHWEERPGLAAGAGALVEPFGFLQGPGTLWDLIPALLGAILELLDAWKIHPLVTEPQTGLGWEGL